jgi:carboxyl-terminal processing protease
VFPDSLKYRTLTSGRVVYGGGGIMPDYFVPLDTSFQSGYFRRLINRGILNTFVLNYVDDNRAKLSSRYPDFKTFNVKFECSDEIMARMTSYATSQELEMNDEDFAKSRDHIRTLIKAYIARDLWNTSDFYQVYNTMNESYLKAIEVLKSSSEYQAGLQASY